MSSARAAAPEVVTTSDVASTALKSWTPPALGAPRARRPQDGPGGRKRRTTRVEDGLEAGQTPRGRQRTDRR